MSETFSAAVGTVDITPGAGLELAGGAFGPAKGVMHPIHAKALYMEQGPTRVLLITCDLLGFDWDYSLGIRRAISDAIGIPVNAIMLTATHTHCAPATMTLRNWGAADPAYGQSLQSKLVALASDVAGRARPARVAAGFVTCGGVAVNRCLGPDGPVNDQLGVARIDDKASGPLAVLLNYAVHPVNLHSSGMISPDFPHYVEQDLRRALGAAVPLFYFSGAGGDLNPANFKASTPSEANAIDTAQKLSRAAMQLLPTLKSSPPDRLDYATLHVDLPLAPLPSREELQRTADEATAQLARFAAPSSTSWEYTGAKTRLEWAREALAALESGRPETAKPVVLHALRVGSLALVGIPGELFTEFGIRLRQASILPHTFVITQANGSVGYLPSSAAYERKTYEAVHCPRYLGLHAFAPNVGQVVADAALALLRQLIPQVRNRQSRDLWTRASRVIVGGGQAHKRPVKYMDRGGPAFIARASGAYFWDVDGHKYIDYLMGYGPIVIGHADPDVNAAVSRQMREGTVYSLEHPLSIDLAEELTRTIPSAEMVVYFIGGSSATLGAIRCARAHTRRQKIIRCGYHGWFDWCWPDVPGVPSVTRELIVTVPYNDLPALRAAMESNSGQVAGVIIEAVQGDGPAAGYFAGVRQLCDEHGALFLLDEVKTGFRFDMGGAQKRFGIDPDISTFGKAMCNGYPASVIVGKRRVMEGRTDTYMAATFHADLPSLAAAMKVIELMRRRDGIGHFQRLGQRLIDGITSALRDLGYPLRMSGFAPMPAPLETSVDDPANPMPPAWKGKVLSEWCAALQRRGVYATGHPWFLSLAHTPDDIERTIALSVDAAKEAISLLGPRS
jgi:glutamate-1-semialdehyde aminotransferase